MLKRAGLWLRSNLQRRRYEREMRAEMNAHLDRATRLLMDRGLPAEEAWRQARREFGDIAYHQTDARDARGTLWLDDLKADSRFAVRHFARKPGTTIMMFIVLAFGMSISTLLFSWVHGLSVMPPPAVRLEDDLVRIRGTHAHSPVRDPRGKRLFEEQEFFAYRNLSSHFTAVAGWVDQTGVLQLPEDAARIGYSADLIFVTENYFRVLGIQPILGAGLPTVTPKDPAANAVAVIDYDTWRDRFGLRRDVLGSIITINGVTITIVGVAPNRFHGARSLSGVQVWLPLPARRLVLTNLAGESDFNAVARLRPGVTREAATAAVQTIAARVDTIVGKTIIRQPGAQVVRLLVANHEPEFDTDIRVIALMLGALGALVLLVTCTNVSGLLTGLASARRREIAVRLSLGAPRTRIIRQLLTESAVLAVVAGAAALAVVAAFLRIAVALIPDVPLELQIDWPTTTFTFAIALAVGILFGLSPALHATRLALASVLRDSSGGIASSRARLQRSLVVAQIALTQPLIVLMTTMLVIFTSDMKPITGSDSADRVITLRVETPSSVNWDFTPEMQRKQRELMLRLRDQVRATPGVEGAVIDWRAFYHPGVYAAHPGDKAGGRPDANASLAVRHVEGTHFDVLGIPIKSGRTFAPADLPAATSSEAPVIIGADLASHLWGAADAVGRRLQTRSNSANSEVRGPRTLVVLGVVDDPVARTRAAGEPYRVYLPADTARSAEYILIRTAAAAAPLLPTIRGLAQNNAASAIITARTLADVEAEHNHDRRRVSGAFSVGGIVALLLSAIGLYAVIAFAVTQRTQEIAVRLAVGANRNQITYAFVREGLRLGAFGLVLGLPAGMFAMRQIDIGQLPVAPIIVIASTGIFLVAAASAWGPARRAAGVDPATALRRG